MISREVAERISNKKITLEKPLHIYSTEQLDWLNYVNILKFPEIASKTLTEEALFVVHPGSSLYYDQELLTDNSNLYYRYVKRLRTKVKSVLGEKTVLVWTEVTHRKDTLNFLDVGEDSVILVPTINSYSLIHEDILGMKKKQFYKELRKYVKSAELMGEQGSGCLKGVEYACTGLIKTQRIKDLIYI